MIADDLFAGAGGWDLAAEALGIHARGVENMPAARATRDAAGLTTIHDDVWTFRPDGQATGLIASPPCQTFSSAGKGTGRKALEDVLGAIRRNEWVTIEKLRALGERVGDERTALVLTPLHFAVQPGYEWLAWEQVKEVLPVWEACADKLRAYGWNVWTGKVYAEQYGVPQTRIRAVLLASRRRPVDRPVPTHSRYYSRSPEKLDEGVEKWVSMAEALGWGLLRRPSYTVVAGGGQRPTNGQEWGSAATRAAMLNAQDDPERWAHRWQMVSNYGTGGDARNRGVRSADSPAPTVTSKVDRNFWQPVPAIEGETAEDVTWVHDRPSPTIVGSYHPEVVAKPGYRKAGDPPRQKTPGSVRITLAEAAVLQSFPADFPFNGGPKDAQGKKFLQVGNAVPPLMALHALAEAAGLALPTVDAEERVA